MKNKLTSIILVFILLAGLSLLLYPTVSDYWNSLHESRAITEYADQVAKLDPDTCRRLWKAAQAYNAKLAETGTRFSLTDEEKADYASQLAAADNGVIAYIEIPKIHCSLPVYRGTEDEILQRAIGHIEWSSLPVGGAGSHCVLSGHRGLPSARLFTDLDLMEVGDYFELRVLDEVLTYEVDQIKTVLPKETEYLEIVDGEDYCTLVTCTPYGVNSHRLLVRGRRTGNREEDGLYISADAVQLRSWYAVPLIAVPMLVLLFLGLLIKTRKKQDYRKSEGREE